MKLSVEEIARVVHEVNAAFCRSIGDNSQKPWPDAEPWQRAAAIEGVAATIKDPKLLEPGAQHQAWMDAKIRDGWKWGPVKDGAAKTHPSLKPFHELSATEQTKDALLIAVVKTIAGL